jgi:hypothetical protein
VLGGGGARAGAGGGAGAVSAGFFAGVTADQGNRLVELTATGVGHLAEMSQLMRKALAPVSLLVPPAIPPDLRGGGINAPGATITNNNQFAITILIDPSVAADPHAFASVVTGDIVQEMNRALGTQASVNKRLKGKPELS